MTVLKAELARLARGLLVDPIAAAPETELTVAPTTAADAASVLAFASAHNLKVLFWGGGTHQGLGHSVAADVVVSTGKLARVIDWQPEDLTIVVEPGLPVAELESKLEQRGQTAVLPETPGGASVGGVVAVGLSGWRRLRYGPTRDRVLEVVLATGDGRVVRGGGRLVKNVTGYDLPRLATGSLGSLGLIASVCLKLWPLHAERAMLEVDDAAAALQKAYRPHAVIETESGTTVYLAGSAAELQAQAAQIGGRLLPGHRWPEPLTGAFAATVRVPGGTVARALELIRDGGWRFQAAHGVGEIRIAGDDEGGDPVALRRWAESVGGALVVSRAPRGAAVDPWGTPPESVELQRRVKAAFDPRNIANGGKLPGGV